MKLLTDKQLYEVVDKVLDEYTNRDSQKLQGKFYRLLADAIIKKANENEPK